MYKISIYYKYIMFTFLIFFSSSLGLYNFIRFKRISNLFSNANDFISITNNFDDFKNLFPGKNNMMNYRTEHPVEIINLIDGKGEDWSYSHLINQINCKEIDAMAIKDNLSYADVIDLNHDIKIFPENIHHVKLLPDNINYLIDIMVHHNVNFEVY